MFSEEFIRGISEMYSFDIDTSDVERFASLYGYEVVHLSISKDEYKFKDADGVIEFYLTHSFGRFDRSHFNYEAIQSYYGDNVANTYDIL